MTKRGLLADRRGNVLIITGFIAIVLFGSVGLAVDATRAWMVRSRLATSLDAAALVAARAYSVTSTAAQLNQIRTDSCNVFWANFGRTGANPCLSVGGVLDTTTFSAGYLGASATNPVLTPTATELTVTARATLNTTFMRVLGINALPEFTVAAAATRIVASLEVSLALDVTGSMNDNNKIQGLRTAAQNFITTIYNGSETRENMWVAMAPYTTHINLGNTAYSRNMVTAASQAMFAPGGAALRDTRGNIVPWPGCVQVRYQTIGTTPGDLTDVAPTADATRYNAWFYPTSLDAAAPPRSLYWRESGGTRTDVAGDNDWTSYVVGSTNVNLRAINEWALNQNTARGADVVTTNTPPTMEPLDITGPNLGCLLHSRYTVLPLTAERTTILNRIAGLVPDPWLYHRYVTGTNAVWLGGTTIHVGLHAAWTTISPNWQGLWSDTPQTVPLPLLRAQAGIKAIVLMTDGLNQTFDLANTTTTDWGRGAPGPCTAATARTRRPAGCPTAGSANYVPTTGYGAYGRWGSGNLTVTSNGIITGSRITAAANAPAELDRRLRQLCTTIKATGVEIYVVGYEVSSSSATETMLRACATTPADYYSATNAAALNDAFISIANRIARVRLVR